MKRTELISVEHLYEGMVLGEDILGPFELLVLSRGKKLSEQNVSVIKKQGLDFIYIEVSSKEEKELKEKYLELESELKEIFTSSGQISRAVKDRIQATLNEMLHTLPQKVNILMELKRLKEKDTYSVKHSIQVGLLSGLMGIWLQLPEGIIQELALAGTMHDIGKTLVPQELLNKPGKLTNSEFEKIQKHTLYGYKKLSQVGDIPNSVCRVALEHHERLDGSGYPAKHTEDNIHFFSKLVTIADIFDASTTNKVYGSRIQPLHALHELEKFRDARKIDPTLFDAFVRNVYKLFVGCSVVLDNGMEGEIAFFHKLSPNRPIIRVNDKLMNLAHHPEVGIKDIF